MREKKWEWEARLVLPQVSWEAGFSADFSSGAPIAHCSSLALSSTCPFSAGRLLALGLTVLGTSQDPCVGRGVVEV